MREEKVKDRSFLFADGRSFEIQRANLPDGPTSLACSRTIVRESRRIAAIIHGE